MIREISIDPISRQVVHIDFQRIDMTDKVRVAVPIQLEGVPIGVKTEGGVLDFITREVEVECLPADIPTAIELDVTALSIGDHLEASDLELPKGVDARGRRAAGRSSPWPTAASPPRSRRPKPRPRPRPSC